MTKRNIVGSFVLIVAVVFVPGSPLQAAPGTWTGWITDARCNPKGPRAEHDACLAGALKQSTARLFVHDVRTERRYGLNDQRRARPWAGQFVTVAGEMTADVITIAAIAPAPAPTVMQGDFQGDAGPEIIGPANKGPKVRGTGALDPGSSVSATPGAGRVPGAGTSGPGGHPTNVLGARGDELRRWMPSLAEAIGAEVGAGLGVGTIAEIDGAIRGIYQSGRIGDFGMYAESAVVVMGGKVTRKSRTAVQARFSVAGGTLVDVEHTPRGEVWFFARPD